jgi:glycosyltransferase involved in cell wall biosynthesis
MPFFSIITVSYNSAKTIAETIESVLNQTIDDFEYIIIDGVSTDETLNIANSYAEKFAARGVSYRVVSEKDNGMYDAINKGISLSNGTIVGVINSDDFYTTDALEQVRAFHRQNPFDLMYADVRVFGNGINYVKRSKHTRRFNTRHWNHPTTFVARPVYDEFRFACESIYDDLDFMLTAIERKKHIAILNRVLAHFRIGGMSNQRSWRRRTERIRLRNRIYKKHNQKGYRLNNWIIETAKFLLG